MKFQDNLKKIKHRLILEALLKAFLVALLVSTSLTAAVLLVTKLIPVHLKWWLYLVIGIGSFFVIFFPVFASLYPTKKSIAKRTDLDNDLKEKVATMVEFENTSKGLAEIQRMDAMVQLSKIDKPKFSFRLSFKNVLPVLISITALTVTACVPYRSAEVIIATDNTELIDQVDEMISQVDENQDLESSDKSEIEEVLEDLKEDLSEADTQEEKESAIDKAEDSLEDIEESEVTYDDIGEAMQEEELLEEIGQEMEEGDTEGVQEKLEELKEYLESLEGQEQKDALEEASQEIQDALENSETDPENELNQSLSDLASSLEEIAQEEGKTQEETNQEIDQAFDKATQEITEEMENQMELEDQIEDLLDQLDQMKEEIQEDQPPQESGDQLSSGMSGGMPGSNSEPPSSMSDISGVSGDMSGTMIYASNDQIYDPDTNSYVTYGELLNYYYNIVNGQISQSDVPDDIMKLLYEYFGNLYYDGTSTSTEMPPFDPGSSDLPPSDSTNP